MRYNTQSVHTQHHARKPTRLTEVFHTHFTSTHTHKKHFHKIPFFTHTKKIQSLKVKKKTSLYLENHTHTIFIYVHFFVHI